MVYPPWPCVRTKNEYTTTAPVSSCCNIVKILVTLLAKVLDETFALEESKRLELEHLAEEKKEEERRLHLEHEATKVRCGRTKHTWRNQDLP